MNTETVIINDVGPRDGLQNQPKHLSVEERLRLIRAVEAAGVRDIEVGSFVSPKAVPAMAGTDQIMAGLDKTSGRNYSALIPNMKGYELARNAGTPTVAMVLYASEGMAQKNVNMSLQQAEAVTLDILERAREESVRIIATIAVAFECPFDGPTDPARVEDIAARFVDAGVEQIVIADTIGAGNPQQVSRLTRKLVDTNGADRVACHFHDTRAMGLANVYAALESGVRRFDASIAGLGGCPFAPGASGNVATEDVVMMLEQMGVSTGIDLGKLVEAVELAIDLTGSCTGGKSIKWLRRQVEKGVL